MNRNVMKSARRTAPTGLRIKLLIGMTAVVPLLRSGGILSMSAFETRGFAVLVGVATVLCMGWITRVWITRAFHASSHKVHQSTARLRTLMHQHAEAVELQANAIRRMQRAIAALETGSRSRSASARS